MLLSFHPCFTADQQIIMGSRSLNSEDFSLISKAQVIILPQTCSLELYQACKNSSAMLFPNYDARYKYPGKVGQSLLFKKTGCPHPETIPWNSAQEFKKAYDVSCPYKFPFLIKEDKSHEAEGIYIISGPEALESALESLNRPERGSQGFISQELIPSEGDVLRVVIMGKRTITYWKRPENQGQLITTVSRGAKIDRDFRVDLQNKGKMQVRLFSASTDINLAAIDIIFPMTHTDPQPLFLEINYYFGRRGLGGSIKYYRLLFEVIQEWLEEKGFNPKSITLV